MSDDLVLYTNPMSRGRIARWMLEETGKPYRTEIVAYGPDMKGGAYRALNPMGKVPTLVHGGTVVTETAAICTYLADIFPDAGLIPAVGSRERGEFYRWMFFGAGPVEQSIVNNTFGFELPEGGSGRAGYGSYELVMNTLDNLLDDREFILGERFSAADVYLGSQIAFGLVFGTIEKRPNFETYAARITSRPAAVRAREIDDKLIEEAKKEAGGAN